MGDVSTTTWKRILCRERIEYEDITKVSEKIPISQRKCGMVRHDLAQDKRAGMAFNYFHMYTVSSW